MTLLIKILFLRFLGQKGLQLKSLKFFEKSVHGTFFLHVVAGAWRLKIELNNFCGKNLVLGFLDKNDQNDFFKCYNKLMDWLLAIFAWFYTSIKAGNRVKLFWESSCFGVYGEKSLQNAPKMRFFKFRSESKHDMFLTFCKVTVS